MTLIWLLKVIQGQRSTERSYMTLYMCYIQTLVTACTVSEIFDLENNLYNQSTPLKFKNCTRITSEKLHDAIHLGSTSILLINIEKYVKMSQTWPFWPWQWPLEWFNQILLFTVCYHHTGEASCKNRRTIKGPWTSIGPLSFCFIEVMHNEFWKLLSSIL